MADYSYKKANPALTVQAIMDSTGVKVDDVLDTPQEVVVISTVGSVDPNDEKQLDLYMSDLGFTKVFP